jgi:hypothetical protein
MGKELEQLFLTKDLQKTKRFMKICSVSFFMRKMQMGYDLHPLGWL